MLGKARAISALVLRGSLARLAASWRSGYVWAPSNTLLPMAKKTQRPIGFILPALVFGLGVAAAWVGIPKEITVRKLSSSGVKTTGTIKADEHDFTGKKRILTLAYEVNGKEYHATSTQSDASIPPDGHPNRELVYVANDPSINTADLAGDSKVANEYLLASALELFVGGWFTFTAIRQRRAALMKAMSSKQAKSR